MISARSGCHIPTVPGCCLLAGRMLSPTLRFWHLRPRGTSMGGQLGPLGPGGRVCVLAFSRNAQALLHGFGCWLSSRCPGFGLGWVGLSGGGGEGGGWEESSSVASGLPFIWLYSLTCCFSLASSASSARAVGGVGAAQATLGQAVVPPKPRHVAQ